MAKEKKEKEVARHDVEIAKSPETQPPASGMGWARLLKRAVLAAVILIVAVAIFLIFGPSPKVTAPPLPNITIGNVTNVTNITEIGMLNITECKRPLFTGGERDDYTYTMRIGGNVMTTDSKFIGKEGDYLVREQIAVGTFKIADKEMSSKSKLRIYMNESYACVRAVVEMEVNERKTQQEVPCAQTGFMMCADFLQNIRNETVTVPAGTFSTEVLATPDNKTIVWVGPLPYPIKIVSGDMMIELKSYVRRA